MSNYPAFDPLNPTPEEDRDIRAGHRAARDGFSLPESATIAFAHGWRVARNDKARVVDDDQAELARRYLAHTRKR
jgi:hypothetical protein